MNYLFVFSLLVLINTAIAKPTSQDDYDPNEMAYEDDQDMQKDDYNEDYEDESKNYAEVNPIPVIVTKPEHLFVKPNTDVTLACALESNRDMFVMLWKRHDKIIFQDTIALGSNSNKYELGENTSLVIKDVNEADSGEYICEIATENNSPKVTHIITVKTPAKILSLRADRNIAEYKSGDTLSLTCNATGIPEPTFTWSLKGHRFDAKGNNLIIENIGSDGSGAYQCLAENDIGPPAHQSILVAVHYKPIVKIEKITSSLNDDSYDVELRCLVRSSPSSIVTWRKDGEVLNRLNRRKKNEWHSINIQSVNESDFGQYSCTAENQMGKTQQHYMLTNAPSKPIHYKDNKSDDRKRVSMIWEVESLFPITKHALLYKLKTETEWKEVAPEVKEPLSKIYYIEHTVGDDLQAGEYEVKVKSHNKFGWSEESTLRSFKVRPSHSPTNHNTQDSSFNEAEHNNIETPPEPALETRAGKVEASSSAKNIPTTSLMLLVLLFLFNRH